MDKLEAAILLGSELVRAYPKYDSESKPVDLWKQLYIVCNQLELESHKYRFVSAMEREFSRHKRLFSTHTKIYILLGKAFGTLSPYTCIGGRTEWRFRKNKPHTTGNRE